MSTISEYCSAKMFIVLYVLLFQIFTMLKAWRDREGAQAYSEILEAALRESKMNDISTVIYL